ncbi:MAG: hypothetical protein KC438_06000 [Thermomicrobiales bacterium]|nr:hypothetical protein [Thermomicrobiales bacterium]MCO5222762.1 hypothetical protein [Thermomicrobiales bacterium]
METTNTFDPRRFVTRVGGADYLEVKWRVYWLRTQHPDAVIATEMISHENNVAVFKAHVSIPGGGSSTGWGSEGYDDFRDYLEKAETKALGRALAALGFGTQFTPDFDFAEGQEKVVDAPVRMARQRQLVDLTDERRVHTAERQSMTDRQMSFIRQMAREKGLSEQAIDAQVSELYGKRFDQLDRRDASSYIERLKSIEPLAQAS